MKIVSWNCNGAFRHKYNFVSELNPDIMVIPESESPDFLNDNKKTIPCNSHIWCGEREFKGLSIFACNGYNARVADFYDNEFKYVIPVEVSGCGENFLLMAVWTKFVGHFRDSYVAQAYRAICMYEQYFTSNTIIIGDFNSNAIWNNSCGRKINHDTLIERLKQDNFTSVYHQLYKEKQGKESISTLFKNKYMEHGYHIDYAFLHENRVNEIKAFTIGEYSDWHKASDHMPLFLDIKNSSQLH